MAENSNMYQEYSVNRRYQLPNILYHHSHINPTILWITKKINTRITKSVFPTVKLIITITT